jgi:hypothetical protein
MLEPSEAPSFQNLNEAQLWANLQSLGEPFYLVRVDYYDDLSMYEFYSFAEIIDGGGLKAWDVIEVWQ